MKPLYSILKNQFGLKDKHITIIRKLDKKMLNAFEICKETSVPQGRIYEYLNELVDLGLIDKQGKKPARYTIANVKENLLWFTKQKIDGLIRSQSQLMDVFKEEQSGAVELIENSSKYTRTHMKILAESKTLRIMAVHRSFPYILYPENMNDFVEIRKIITHARPTITYNSPETVLLIYRSYMDAIRSGKRIEVIFEKESFDFHISLLRRWLTKSKFRSIINGMIEKLKSNNLRVCVIDEYSPMEVDFSEKQVCLSLNYVGVTNGIIISSRDAVSFMSQVFDEKVNRSQDVISLLEAIKI